MDTIALDDAILAYMDRYYAKSGVAADYYRSSSSRRNVLSWHKDLILMPRDHLADEFQFQGSWLGENLTREELVSKAQEFRNGFCEFIGDLGNAEARTVLDELKRAIEYRNEKLLATCRLLALEYHQGMKRPPTPESN